MKRENYNQHTSNAFGFFWIDSTHRRYQTT